MHRYFQIHSNMLEMTDLHFRLNCTNGQQQQNRTVILFFYIYPFTFFLPYYSYLELATVLCLHLNGILIDPPYLWDTFAAPSKRAREIDFVEVSEAKRYPSELIIVQNLHGTRTVGYLLLTHRQQQHAAASADVICAKKFPHFRKTTRSCTSFKFQPILYSNSLTIC